MKKDKMVTFRIIIVLMFIVGLAITSATAMVIFNNYRKFKIFTPITAKVVDYNKKDNGLKSIIIEYNINEKYYKITSKHYSKKPEKIDSEIRIKYNPEDPSQIIWIDNNHNKKYLASGIILVSGSALIFLVLTLLDKKKAKKVVLEQQNSIVLPTEKEIVNEISDIPVQKDTPLDMTITEAQTKKEEIITLEQKQLENVNQIMTETSQPIVEQKVENQSESQQLSQQSADFSSSTPDSVPTPQPEVPKQNTITPQEVVDPILPKIETPKIVIQELPVDDDSPREAVTSNILDMTVAMPALTKEDLTIELPVIKQD